MTMMERAKGAGDITEITVISDVTTSTEITDMIEVTTLSHSHDCCVPSIVVHLVT